ncbi:L-2-amino-thiazoline-4-carboxylic acid hydrolase [Alkalicoccobacillus murimartini]|uniref:L-2-amino-thiazoline-4-carboxylic acid hydrolase n=1 Tax=Alkalicoccobacillus murimartini TaxID=171685 RepID=A0ABT9YGX4_9BACI|nr:L-2-amino-thiazoline-4-carboxylic acid hydrolase [Alkalicoccobacillus murimartini]MDQ0206848.1 hypothetical protein [Alkalicoccobacillus murimartini]
MSTKREPLPTLSMYTITAKLVTHLENAIIVALGEEARTCIRQGMMQFGLARVRLVSDQATDEGEVHCLSAYLSDDIETKEAKQEHQSIYVWMAKLFAEITKAVVDKYGEAGQDAVREGVRTFGQERGRGIASRANHMGQPNTLENYLSNYDMGRSELFEFENVFTEKNIEQTFTKCPFGQQWVDDGMGEYGILYCEMIDPAVAKGYNTDFEVEHDQYVIKDGVCHFNFSLHGKKGLSDD